MVAAGATVAAGADVAVGAGADVAVAAGAHAASSIAIRSNSPNFLLDFSIFLPPISN